MHSTTMSACSGHARARAPSLLGGQSFIAGFFLAILGPIALCSAQTFTDVTGAAGINHTQFQVQPQFWEYSEHRIMTGGAAARDFDGDGFVDIIFTRMDAPPILYRNLGDGTFEALDHTVTGINVPAGSNGVAWGDINNNGHADLYITTVNQNRNYLYVNNGDGTFTEQAVARQVDVSGKGAAYGASFGDFDNDGYLDLFTTSWDDSGGVGNRLFQNQGSTNPGHFTDVTMAAGVGMAHLENILGTTNITYGFTPRFTDLDGDGHVDLAISGDFGTSRLFWNNGDGTFTDGTAAAGVGLDRNGMGGAVGDFNRDGKLDWFVSAIWDEDVPPNVGWLGDGSFLYTNEGDRTFTGEAMDTHWGWGSTFFDYNNNGWQDLVVVNGFHVPPEISTVADAFRDNPAQLFRNDGGTLTEVAFSEGVVDFGSGKGVLVADFNNNGKLDLVIINNEGAPTLLLNESDSLNDWIGFDTIGEISNRDGFGALITVTVDGISQIFEVNGSSNFLAQNDKRAHFGLGLTDGFVDEIQISWPSGLTQSFFDVPANAYYILHETEGLSLAYPIPEPATFVMAAIAALALLGRGAFFRTHANRSHC